MKLTRRGFLGTVAAGVLAAEGGVASEPGKKAHVPERIPVIDITDLYHPPQDPGDNVDLITAYGLPEVDLKAVILDVTQRYRRPYVNEADHSYDDPAGKRDPGFVSVLQLDYIFGRRTACGVGPFESMSSPEDAMRRLPGFQEEGIELMLDTLRRSPEPVEITSFGSARPLAVALNRAPDLLREKVRRVHLCAGSAPAGYVEWNVSLDPHAFVRVLRSDLPVAVYPCADESGPWGLGQHNTFWQSPDFGLIRRVAPPLRRYLAFVFERTERADFLVAMEDEVPEEVVARIAALRHNVWETDVWMHVAKRKLVRLAEGGYRIVPEKDVQAGDTVISSELLPCTLDVRDDGQFTFALTEKPTPFSIFFRKDPEEHQRALIEALPRLYESYLRA